MPADRIPPGTTTNPAQADLDRLAQLFSTAQLMQALELADSLCSRFPQHGFAWKVAGAVHLKLGDYENSLRTSTRAHQLLAGDASVLNNMGAAYLGLSQFAQARDCLRKALAIAPDYAKAHFHLASALLKTDQLAEAEQHFRCAIQFDPLHAAAHFGLGQALELQSGTLCSWIPET
jgi:tetratricopeptide (TPR) repeat protein